MISRMTLCGALAVLFSACSGEISDPALDGMSGVAGFGEVPQDLLDVTLWVDPHDDFDTAAVLDGCSGWLPVGMTCSHAAVKQEAVIKVEIDDKECVPDEKGGVILGVGWFYHGWGLVTLYIGCLPRNEDGTLVDSFLISTVLHEIGHTLGMSHVTFTCVEGEDPNNALLIGADGEPICGYPAAMNPLIVDPPVLAPTALDLRAFDVRLPDAVEPKGAVQKSAAGAHSCALSYQRPQ